MRFGRKRDEEVEDLETPEEGLGSLPAVGPFDDSTVDVEEHEGIDLGSLLVTPDDRTEVQLQVDEASGEVAAVLLVGDDAALELRAFASSRGGGAWDDLRPEIAAEVARLGGTATERQGTFGTELICMVPVQTPDGQPATQPTRVTGHEGPAWLLRATLHGAPALQDEDAEHESLARWDETIRRVVVRRGRDARAPGAALPLRLPPDARRAE